MSIMSIRTVEHAALLAAAQTFLAADVAYTTAGTQRDRARHALARNTALLALEQIATAQGRDLADFNRLIARRPDPEPKRTAFIVHAVAQARAFHRSFLRLLRHDLRRATEARRRRDEWLKSARTAKAGAK